jgi:hypothetical protein
MKEIYIDGELDTVETANWFPKSLFNSWRFEDAWLDR